MSIRDIGIGHGLSQEVANNPTRFSVAQLKSMEGKVPGYILYPAIQYVIEQQKRMQLAQSLQQPPVSEQPSVVEQIKQEAAQMGGGVEQLPSNLPQEYAEGGIVAFADNKDQPVNVDMPSERTNPPLSAIFQSILGISPTEEQYEEDRIKKERARIEDKLRLERLREEQKTKAGIETLVAPPSAAITNMSAAEMAVPGMGGYEAPVTAPRRTLSAEETQQVIDQMRAKGMRVGLDTYRDVQAGRIPPEISAAKPSAVAPDAPPQRAVPPAAKPPAAGPGFAGFGGYGVGGFGIPADLKPKSAVEEYRRQMYGTETEPGLLARSEARQRRLDEQVAAQQNKVTGQAYETLEKQLRKEEEERGTEKEQAKAMAIFKAGLAIMSGTSPRALENIGKGAMVGAEDWQKASAEIKKAEKEHRRMLAEIDQARRAEKIGDRDKMIARLDKANEHAQRMDEQGVRGFMAAFGMDEETAREVWKTKYSAAKSVEVAAMQQEGKIESAMLRGMLSGSGEKGAMTQKQRGDTLLALETSPNVMAYKKQLIDKLGTKAQDTQQFKNAVAEKVQQEYKRLYGDRGIPSGPPGGYTPQQLEFIKKEGLAQYFSGLQ